MCTMSIINFMMPLTSKVATKTFEYNVETCLWNKTHSYEAGKYFRGFSIEVEDIEQAYNILEENQEYPVFMIHGDFIPGTDLSNMVRRKRKHVSCEGGCEVLPTITDRLINFFCLDIDGYIAFDGDISVERFIQTHLPEPFWSADYIYQYSASFGLTTKPNELKVHIFFWLKNPATNEDIRAWIRDYNLHKDWGNIIDDSVLVATQPCYTQKRICIGAEDPIKNFIGLVKKEGPLSWTPQDLYQIRKVEDKRRTEGIEILEEGNLVGLIAPQILKTNFDLATAVNEIVAGKRFHENVRSLSLSFMNDGIPVKKVKETIKGIMKAVSEEKKDERWHERYDDIDRAVDSAADIVGRPDFYETVEWIQKSQESVVQFGFAERLVLFEDPGLEAQLLQLVEEKLQIGRAPVKALLKIAKQEKAEKELALAREIEASKRATKGLIDLNFLPNNWAELTTAISHIIAQSDKEPYVYRIGSGLGTIALDTPKTVRQVMQRHILGEDYPKMPIVQDITKSAMAIRAATEKSITMLSEKGAVMPIPDNILLSVPMNRTAPWRPLTGITEHPYISYDYKLVQKEGYDTATGLFSSIHRKLKLTQMDPKEAYEYLGDVVFAEFPFETEMDKAVAIGALLTAIQRPIISGETGMPGFAVVSPKPASGKTTLVQLISYAVYNRPCAATSYSANEEEMGKHLLAILKEGHGTVLFDNLPADGAIKSNELAMAMTGEVYSKRRLGDNVTDTVPSNVLWLFTGNNIYFKGDFSTRILPCNLLPQVERPEQRTFTRNSIGEWAGDNRKKILSAALSIIISAKKIQEEKIIEEKATGKYTLSKGKQSRFKEWDKFVRLPILKLSGQDLLDVFERNLYKQDTLQYKREFLNQLFETFGEKYFISKDILVACEGYSQTVGNLENSGKELKEALMNHCGDKNYGSVKTLGRHLAQLEGDQVGNLRLYRKMMPSGESRWKIVVVSNGEQII